MAARRLVSVDYEVFGRVQGVFFRKYTEDQARELGLVGWVKNTSSGTVCGTMQGPEDRVARMKTWLQSTGSPKSRIDRCVFMNENQVENATFEEFKIVKEPRHKKVKKKSKP